MRGSGVRRRCPDCQREDAILSWRSSIRSLILLIVAMFHWREDYFQTLRDVAVEARAFPEWADYADFCSEYEKGLRRQAFAILERFIGELENAPFDKRRRFVSWILNRANEREGRNMLIPHPLHRRVVEPTLLEWTTVEAGCSEPHRWLGDHEHLKLAVELDPDDQLARKKLVVSFLSRVGFATHELPHHGYIGSPSEGLAALDEAEALVRALGSDKDREQLTAAIAEERTLIDEYLRGS